MFKAMLKKQLQEGLAFLYQSNKKGERRSAGAIIGMAILFLFCFFSIGMLFFMMADTLCEPLYMSGFWLLYFTLLCLMSVALGVLGSVFMTYNSLYVGKDNELLISMPIPSQVILITRMLGIYFMALVFSAIVILPGFFRYYVLLKDIGEAISGLCILNMILLLILLPLLEVVLSCLLGYVVALIAPHVKNKSIVTLLISLLFLGAYYYFYFQMNAILQKILLESVVLGAKIKKSAYPFYLLGKAAEGEVFPMIGTAVVILAAFGLLMLLLSKNFYRMATEKQHAKKIVYREKSRADITPSAALFRKELTHFYQSAVYMLNAGLGSVFLLLGGVLVLIKSSSAAEYLAMFGMDLSAYLPVMLTGAIMMILSMNVVTAPSISLEGKSIWILQSLPVDPWLVLKSKLKLHLTVSLLPAVFCAVVLSWTLKIGVIGAILSLAVIVLFTVFCGEFGLAVNLRFPNLNWNNESVAVKQSMSVLIAMFGMWMVIIVIGFGYFAICDSISSELFLLIAALFFLVMNLIFTRFLKTKGARIFAGLH